jgi:D-sedoheptulose 7-phosphate isomerase
MNRKKALNISDLITDSIVVKTRLLDKGVEEIEATGKLLAETCKNGGKIMFCGNGGSAADSQHIAAELVIRYRGNINRAAIPAMALTVDPSIMTAGGNDYGFENVFARQVEAYGRPGDLLVGISTSGNSENVIKAIQMAKSKNITVVGLLGSKGGKILPLCDKAVVVPSDETARIQESHIMIGHIWCEIIEEFLFPELF